MRTLQRARTAIRLWAAVSLLGLTTPLWWTRTLFGWLLQRFDAWEAGEDYDPRDESQAIMLAAWAGGLSVGMLAPLWMPVAMSRPRVFAWIEERVPTWIQRFSR
jgi:hypothetical protein